MSLSRRTTAVLAAIGTAAAAVTVALVTGGSTAGAAPGCPAEPSFDSTIPEPLGAPAATTLSDDSIAFATLGGDRRTYFDTNDITGEPLLVSPLACLGGGATDNPAVLETTTGISFFVRSANGRIHQNDVTEATPDGTGWRQLPYGATTNGPAGMASYDGSLDLFVRGDDGALHRATRSPAGAWSPFRSLGGGFVGTPAVAIRPGGGLIVVVRNAAGELYSKSSNAAGAWGSTWTRLPGASATSPALAMGYAAGRIDLFVIGAKGGLHQSAYTGGRFGAFRTIEPSASTRARIAAAGAPGRMIVYVRDDFGQGRFQTAYTQFLPSGWTGDRTGNSYFLVP